MSTDQTNNQDGQPEQEQPQRPPHVDEKQILILPMEAVDQSTSEAIDRAIDIAVQRNTQQQLAKVFALGLPAPPVAMQFIDAHLAELRSLNRRGFTARGKGCVYIHDRLDEPPPSYAKGYSIDPTQRPTMIGGYQAVHAKLDQLVVSRPLQEAARQYSSADQVVLHIVTADATNPDAYDQPYIIVLPWNYQPGQAEQPAPEARQRRPDPTP